ncbi:hypothetical protein AMBLS11_12315 [Alteromonas macleodii str. 'Black Sea 11']|nr:hypothetical protein AMBLS11_12315 [Alteromonas macleodii str. 'Black Sea 11']
MFKLVKQIERLEWPVKVVAPAPGGKTETHTFTAFFKILPQKEYDKALREAKSDSAFVAKFLTGWEGVNDHNDEPLAFSKKALNDMCEFPFVRTAIIKAYNEAASGAAVKN